MAAIRTGDIAEAVERTFREFVAERPYQSVTVLDICERAHLSRKSFYAYYSNKDDIVSSIFKRDVIKPIERINAVFSHREIQNMGPLIYIKMYQALYDNREFYRALVRPVGAGADAFVRVATDAIYDYDLPLITSLDIAFSDQQADYIAYYFASSQAMLMKKWIIDGMTMPVEELAGLYLRMSEAFWTSSAKSAR